MKTSQLGKKGRVLEIVQLLEKEYPSARIALIYSNPLELLIATMLSAQCTDQKVNEVTKSLFKKYRKAEDYAMADLEKLEREIRSTGFYRNKARNIKEACQTLVDKFDSEVPKSMAELILLPGVARKTANIVLSNAYGIIEGIAVDTHVRRMAKRLDLTKNVNPEKIEKDLMEIVPKEKWARFTYLLIFHGRKTCNAKKPNCDQCILSKICPLWPSCSKNAVRGWELTTLSMDAGIFISTSIDNTRGFDWFTRYIH